MKTSMMDKYTVVLILLVTLTYNGLANFGVEFSAVPIYAEENETISFTCNSTSNVAFSIKCSEDIICFDNCNTVNNYTQCSHLDSNRETCSHSDGTLTFDVQNAWTDNFISTYICEQRNLKDEVRIHRFEKSTLTWLSDFTQKEGMDFNVNCSATNGTPEAQAVSLSFNYFNYSLMANESEVNCSATQCGIRVLSPSRDLHETTVLCQAYQVNGRDPETISERLNITFPPVVASPHIEKLEIIVNESKSLKCEVTRGNEGNPHYYHYYWTRTRDDYNESTENGSLEITPTDECWDDVYSCCPYNYAGTGDCGMINVTVLVSANGKVLPDLHTLYYNHQLNLSCSCEGKPPPVIEWNIIENTKLFEYTTTTNDTTGDCNLLNMATVELSWKSNTDEGNKLANGTVVECLCDNNVREILHSKEVTLNVEYPPQQAHLNTSATKVNINESLELTCGFAETEQGNPNADEYQFYAGSTNISNWNASEKKTISIFSIAQEGGYTCNGRNDPRDVERKEGNESVSRNIQVFVIPEIQEPSSRETFYPVYNDETFTIHCRAIGKPDPNIILQRNGNNVTEDEFTKATLYFQEDGPYGLQQVTHTNFTWNIRNIGSTCSEVKYFDDENYKCVAHNQGTDDHHISSSLITIETQYPAFWNSSSNATYVAYGHSVEIICDVCANPTPNFTWHRESDLIGNEKILMKENVTDNDFGLYTCTALNSIGQDTFGVLLKEDGAPRIRNVSVSESTSMSLTVTWVAFSHGGHPPVSFRISYSSYEDGPYTEWSKKLNSSSDEAETLSETITHLNASEAYFIVVEAASRRDTGNTSTKTTNDTTREQPVITLETPELRGTELTVKWAYKSAVFGSLLNEEYSVTVRASYSPDGKPDTKIYPPCEELAVDAEDGKVVFQDKDLTRDCTVQLLVYENDILNEFIIEAEIPVDNIQNGISPGAISGIVIGVLLVAALVALVGFLVYTDRLSLPFIRSKEEDYVQTNDRTENPYEFENMSYEPEGTATNGYDEDMPYMNIDYRGKTPKPTVAPKPYLRKQVDPSTLPSTRMVDDDNCIYIRLDGLEFPKYKPPKPGQAPVIHGLDKLSVYASIDFTRRAPTPEPPEYDDEDVMAPLPPRPEADEDAEN